MKTAKRIFTLTLIIILTIGVSGCTFQSNKKIMTEHLEKNMERSLKFGMCQNRGIFLGAAPLSWIATPRMAIRKLIM
jgi:hypothetical protein